MTKELYLGPDLSNTEPAVLESAFAAQNERARQEFENEKARHAKAMKETGKGGKKVNQTGSVGCRDFADVGR